MNARLKAVSHEGRLRGLESVGKRACQEQRLRWRRIAGGQAAEASPDLT